MKKFIILKLLGLVLLTMATLVSISILEVTVYSYLINPDKAETVYEAHAELTAPYISGIFGFVIFFLVVRYWKKRAYANVKTLAMLFPLFYILVDLVVILSFAFEQWKSLVWIFVLANMAKALGSYLGYKLTQSEPITAMKN